MSYDFYVFKLKKSIQSWQELSEETTASIGSALDIKTKLTNLLPSIVWEQGADCWFGVYQGEDTWYEFMIENKGSIDCFSIGTSFRANTRDSVRSICDAMGVVAFDGHVGQLIGSLHPAP